MMSAQYFMKFRGQEFEAHVLEKFHNLFPDMQERETEDLKSALKHIQFRSIVPVFKDNGEVDGRYKRGISHMLLTGSIPASIGASPLSSPKIDGQCIRTNKTEQGPETLGLVEKYSKTMVKDYHNCQRELFRLLKIPLDDGGRMLVNRSSNTSTTTTTTSVTTTTTKTITFTNGQLQATTEEFVQIIDNVSKYVMEECKALGQPTAYPDLELEELNKKIDLCFVILIKRLLIQQGSMESTNDFMTENGWKTWREHSVVAASFAVYFLSLQLYHYKKCGTFLHMTD